MASLARGLCSLRPRPTGTFVAASPRLMRAARAATHHHPRARAWGTAPHQAAEEEFVFTPENFRAPELPIGMEVGSGRQTRTQVGALRATLASSEC